MSEYLDRYDADLMLFTAAHEEAMYFAETGDEASGEPPDWAPLDSKSAGDMAADCRSFWRRFGCYVYAVATVTGEPIDDAIKRAGNAFWFTRNSHGAGFWDTGCWPEAYADVLVKAAKSYGEVNLQYDEESETIYTL